MVTSISLSPAAVPVGEDMRATMLLPGDLILIEGREVDGYFRGDGAEVVALVLNVKLTEDRLFMEVFWIGAVAGRTTTISGVALYDPPASVTMLRSCELTAVAA